MEKQHQARPVQEWDERQTRARYDDFIAHPEGGREYADEVLRPGEFAQVLRQHARAVEQNLLLLGRTITPELREALSWSQEDLSVVQQRNGYTWEAMGKLLDDATCDYLSGAYRETSVCSPAASVPSE